MQLWQQSLSLCGWASIRPMHIWTLQFYSAFLCKTAQALPGCTGIRCEQAFSCPATNSLLDWSLSHSWIFTLLTSNHFYVVFVVCLGCCLAVKYIFSQVVVLYSFIQLLYSSHPFPSAAFQCLLLRSIPKAWCCHHHASWWGWCVFAVGQTLSSLMTQKLHFGLMGPQNLLPDDLGVCLGEL